MYHPIPHAEAAAELSDWLGSTRPSLLLLGRVNWMTGKCESAYQILTRLVNKYPDEALGAWWLFWLQGAQPNQIPAAIGATKMAGHAESLGWWAQRNGFRNNAIAWYELSLKIRPSHNLAERLVALYRSTGTPEKATSIWADLSAAIPSDQAEHWWAEGQLAEQDKQWAAASRSYRLGAELATSPYDYLIREAAVLQQIEDWSGVERAYAAAIQAKPDAMQPYLGLGHVRRREQDYANALTWYQKAQTVAPNSTVPLFYLGELWFEQDNCDQARSYFQRVLELEPKHAKSLYYLAICAHQEYDTRLSLELLSRAIEANAEHPWQWAELLGDWRLAAGDRHGAQVAYEQALSRKPENIALQNKLQQLINNP
jgi:Flp pilus assembly protein TadD